MNPRRTPVAEEPARWYVDKLSGRRLSFRPKADELIVTFAAGDEEALRRLVADPRVRSLRRGDASRGFAVIHPAGDLTAAELVAAEPVAAIDLITAAQPAFVDPSGVVRYFVPGQLTVQFRGDVVAEQARHLIERTGARVLVRQRTDGYYTISVPDGVELFEAIRRFGDLPEVAFAEPSEIGFDSLLYVPNDADFGELWGMHNTGQSVNGTTGVAGNDIDAILAWDLHRGDPDVIVAVLDTGIDLDHPDLAANILPRGAEDWDFDDPNDPVPTDTDGHGTHVAGTAVGVDNGIGVIGVAPGCRVMPLRMDMYQGMNQNRADAINYVADQAVAHPQRRYVINCSWGTPADVAAVRSAIANVVANNVVVCAAAGNDGIDTEVTPHYPAGYPGVISVAALDQSGTRAIYTDGQGSNYGAGVTVAAPGKNVYSSVPDDTYEFKDGTSMAAPHVTGLAALVWSANLGLSSVEVRQVIEETCVNVDALNPGFAGQLGRGMVNAFGAVTRAQYIGEYVPSVPALS